MLARTTSALRAAVGGTRGAVPSNIPPPIYQTPKQIAKAAHAALLARTEKRRFACTGAKPIAAPPHTVVGGKCFAPGQLAKAMKGQPARCRNCEHRRIAQTRYGVAPKQYNALWRLQRGKCALCRRDLRFMTRHMDHCHRTGVVRGLLCLHCNMGLGHLRDKAPLALEAIRYLIETSDPKTAKRHARRALTGLLRHGLIPKAEAAAARRGEYVAPVEG